LSIIDVVLAGNREYNVMVQPVMDHLKKEMDNKDTKITFLKEKTFDSLLQYLKENLSDYYDQYIETNNNNKEAKELLNKKREFIKGTLQFKEVNFKKMKALFDILKAIKKLTRYKTNTDYEFMEHWATITCEDETFKHKDGRIKKNKFETVLGEKIRNVGLATLQHLRMHFGADTFKPDQRVKEVLLYKFLNLSEEDFSSNDLKDEDAFKMMSKVHESCGTKNTDYSMRILDSVFVNYGSGYYNKNDPSLEFADSVLHEILQKLIDNGVDINLVCEVSGYSTSEFNAV
jgi:hypothetical protein